MSAIRAYFDFYPEARLEKEKLRSCLDRSDWMIRKELMDDSDEFDFEPFEPGLDSRNFSNKPRC